MTLRPQLSQGLPFRSQCSRSGGAIGVRSLRGVQTQLFSERETVSAHEEAEIDAPAKAYNAAVDKQLFSDDI